MFYLLVESRSWYIFQAEDGIRDIGVTGVQTCALPISKPLSEAQDHRLRGRGRRGEVLDGGLGVDDVRLDPRARRVRALRSEERRVGKECRFRWWPDH